MFLITFSQSGSSWWRCQNTCVCGKGAARRGAVGWGFVGVGGGAHEGTGGRTRKVLAVKPCLSIMLTVAHTAGHSSTRARNKPRHNQLGVCSAGLIPISSHQ
jgi:hypothetical protein